MYIFRLMTMYLYIEIYSGLWPINRRAIYFVAIEEEYQNFFNQNPVFSMRLINIAPLNYLLQYTLHLELKLCYKTVHLNHTSKVYIILYPIMYIPDSGLFDIHYMPPQVLTPQRQQCGDRLSFFYWRTSVFTLSSVPPEV